MIKQPIEDTLSVIEWLKPDVTTIEPQDVKSLQDANHGTTIRVEVEFYKNTELPLGTEKNITTINYEDIFGLKDDICMIDSHDLYTIIRNTL